MSLIKEFVYRFRGEYTTEKLIKRGLKVGRNFQRLNGVIIDPAHCWLINIGDNVGLGPRVHILAHDASTKGYLNYTKIGRVNIGNNVFVGAESVILLNVTIGDNVIIGANSTVTKDIPSGCVYAGNPAKFICTTQEYINRNKELMKKSPCYGEEYTLRKNINSNKKNQMYKELENKMGFVD
ncbi:2,3,4,5-tetrahydropyridine-2,6-dicarboxylate N-acetyltransferase [Terrisporobacter petrolearius]|uniref:2,3,4,5-tetrahydropyridine-2,6-dicarboxylate N-acetyltransferase n=1 Tax=Terrisporobacter petrolearius TaxID=1460447 RepID=A0ABZ3FBU8_9FIRM